MRERAKRGQRERECETCEGWVRMRMREWMMGECWVRSWRKTGERGRKDWGREGCECDQRERARSGEIGKGWCDVSEEEKRAEKDKGQKSEDGPMRVEFKDFLKFW